MSNILSVEELIKEKTKFQLSDKPIRKILSIPRLNAKIEIEMTKSIAIDAMDMTKDEEQAKQADNYLVYTIVQNPNLKDKELQKAYECEEPMDIVQKVFTDGEITDIVEFAFKSVGYERGTVKVVEELKN